MKFAGEADWAHGLGEDAQEVAVRARVTLRAIGRSQDGSIDQMT